MVFILKTKQGRRTTTRTVSGLVAYVREKLPSKKFFFPGADAEVKGV